MVCAQDLIKPYKNKHLGLGFDTINLFFKFTLTCVLENMSMHMVRNCPFIKRKQQPDFERNNSSLVKGFCYTPLPYKPLGYYIVI